MVDELLTQDQIDQMLYGSNPSTEPSTSLLNPFDNITTKTPSIINNTVLPYKRSYKYNEPVITGTIIFENNTYEYKTGSNLLKLIK